MSQNELAQHLQITQSFLSAIENGKSPLPTEKEAKILEIFSLRDLSGYTADGAPAEKPKESADMSDGDLINQLLNRFNNPQQAKEADAKILACKGRISELEQRNSNLLDHAESLLARNDELSARNDELRSLVDKLREEIYRLRLIIASNGLDVK